LDSTYITGVLTRLKKKRRIEKWNEEKKKGREKQ
jgi:hypothetical protein